MRHLTPFLGKEWVASWLEDYLLHDLSMSQKSVILCLNVYLFRLEFDVGIAAVVVDALRVDFVSLYEVLVRCSWNWNRRAQLLLLETLIDYCL